MPSVDRDGWSTKVRVATGLGITGRAITILVRFASVPLTIALVNPEQFGLWLMILSFVGWLGMTDLGIPSALQNRLAFVFSLKDRSRGISLVAYSLQLLAGVGLVIVAGGVVVAWVLPSIGQLGIRDDAQAEFRYGLFICLVTFAVGLPTRVAGALFNAHGRVALPPLVDIVSQIASFGMLLIAVFREWHSITVLAMGQLCGLLIGPFAALVIAMSMFGYRWRGDGEVNKEDKKVLLGKGGYFVGVTIGELLILQTDAVVIAYVLSPEHVPRYLIPAILFNNFLALQNTFLRPLWPMLTQCHINGDIRLAKKTIARLMCISVLLAIATGIVVLAIGDWFIRLWSHNAASLPPVMAFGVASYVLVASVDAVLGTALNAFGLIEARLYYTVTFGIIKVIGGIVVLSKLGIECLPIAYAAIMMCVSVPWAARELSRAMGAAKQT